MIEHNYSQRVRYEDADRMGLVYHPRYISYFEFARTELVRDLGITYREMEDQGILLPVTRLEVKYRRPAHYDDQITVKTIIRDFPRRMLELEQSVVNDAGDILVVGKVVLAFVNKSTMRPMVAPDSILNLFRKAWKAPMDE